LSRLDGILDDMVEIFLIFKQNLLNIYNFHIKISFGLIEDSFKLILK